MPSRRARLYSSINQGDGAVVADLTALDALIPTVKSRFAQITAELTEHLRAGTDQHVALDHLQRARRVKARQQRERGARQDAGVGLAGHPRYAVRGSVDQEAPPRKTTGAAARLE